MLKFKAVPWEQLEKLAEQRFVRSVAQELGLRYPERFLRFIEERSEQFVRSRVAIAAGFGITRECDVRGFIRLEQLVSEDFSGITSGHWAYEILTSSVDPSSKVICLTAMVDSLDAGG
jgi:hypothetical protein